MPLTVEVLDLGINNLASLRRGLSDAGARELRIIATAEESRGADLLVLPGVGSFGSAVDELTSRGLDDTIRHHVARGGYLFGVCLGMQLLASTSEESPGIRGLGLIPGAVRRLDPGPRDRVPNIGWSESVAAQCDGPLPVLHRDVDYYFVHSYAVVPESNSDILATSSFGGTTFVSAIRRDSVLGVQFHPEKSSRPGAQLLTEVLEWANG
jgi:glutamine amidotransferase